MKAANVFLQVRVEDKKGGFIVSDASLLEGKIVSAGDNATFFKKGQKVLFPSHHGKVFQHSISGENYYFVDEEIVLAYE